MKPLTVLVADDEEDIRILLDHWLTEARHQVRTVSSAADAIKLANEGAFDLLITDVLMPDCDGLQLIGAIKKVQPALRILAISGGGRYMAGDNCLKIARGFGAHWALMKPFDRNQLLQAVKEALTPQKEATW